MLVSLVARVALFGVAVSSMSLAAVTVADATPRGGTPPVASAAPGHTKKPAAVKIVSPKPNALVRAHAAPVKIKGGPEVSAIRVFDGTQDVTRKFKRKGSVWTAKLSLKPGKHRLLVESKSGKRVRDAKRVTFIAGRSRPSSATVRSGAVAGSSLSQGPTGTESYQPSGALPVSAHTKAASIATLTVNGRKVADVRAKRFLDDHSWLVSAGDGLRVGKNRLVMKSYDERGRYAVKRWTVRRDATIPLPEAGPRERSAKPASWTVLDGTQSKASQRGAKLTYAWRVVGAPKGAKPVLLDAGSPHPRFKADVSGFYQVALRVSQTSRKRAASTSEDVITLSVWPPLPAQGMWVDTGFYDSQSKVGSSNNNSLWFWGSAYPAFTGDPNVCLQFDEVTMGTANYGMPKDMQPTQGLVTVCAWGATSLTGDNAESWMPFTQYNGSAIWIGTKLVAYNGANNDWTPGTGNPTSNLHGWLKPASSDAADNAAWIDTDMIKVQTRATVAEQGTSGNTIDLNGTAYTVTLPQTNDTGGFELLTLDNTGSPKDSPTVYGFSGNPTNDAPAEQKLASDLLATNGGTFLLQGFGTLPNFSSSGPLSTAINEVGGRSDVLSRLNGAQDPKGAAYSLVAGTYTFPGGNLKGWRAKEASAERTGTANINALLVRDSTANDYIPLTYDTAAPDVVGQGHNDLLPLVYQAPSDPYAWMPNGSGGFRYPNGPESAAFDDIQSAMVTKSWISPQNPLCTGAIDTVRSALCNNDETDLTNIATDVRGLSFDATEGSTGNYTTTDFTNVQSVIVTEFTNASTIRSTIAEDYQSIFGTLTTSGAVDAPQIAGWITSDIAKSADPTTTNYSAFLSALTDMLSALLSDGAAAAMTFTSGAFGFESDLTPNSSPTQDLENDVQVTQTTAAAELTTSLQNASTQLGIYGDYLASDPVKLQQGANLFSGELALSGSTKSYVQYAGQYGTQQWLWGTLLAAAYTAWTGPASFGTNPACLLGGSQPSNSEPFSNLDASGRWSAFDSSGAPTLWYIGLQSENSTWLYLHSGIGLSPGNTDKLFGAIAPTQAPSASTNVGATMPYFALDYLPFTALPVNPIQTYPTYDTGCLPFR